MGTPDSNLSCLSTGNILTGGVLYKCQNFSCKAVIGGDPNDKDTYISLDKCRINCKEPKKNMYLYGNCNDGEYCAGCKYGTKATEAESACDLMKQNVNDGFLFKWAGMPIPDDKNINGYTLTGKCGPVYDEKGEVVSSLMVEKNKEYSDKMEDTLINYKLALNNPCVPMCNCEVTWVGS
jgi:hypothetical protein